MNSDSDDAEPKPQPKPVVVAPKVAVIRRPRNILRPEHLISKKGIAALPPLLTKETKFKGKGHELADLKLLLFKTKHWAHRLFPAATFEDFIEKAEQLGPKRPVKNFLYKIRQNLPLNLDGEDDLVMVGNSDGEDEGGEDSNKLEKLLNDPNSTKNSGLDYSSASKPSFDFDQLFKDHIEDMKKKDQAEADAALTKESTNNSMEHNSPPQPSKIAKNNQNFDINELDALVDDADFDDFY